MVIRFAPIAALAPLAMLATPALAQEVVPSSDAAMGLILAGDHARAERQLVSQLDAGAEQPALLLNLAAVYVETGRPEAARATYRRVLDQRDLYLERSNGAIAGSHTLARRGIAQLDARRVAQR